MNDKGEIITDSKKVSNKFNTYFNKVAQKLAEKIPKTNNKFQDYLKNPNEHSLYLTEVYPDEVHKLLKQLNTEKSQDIFGISPKLLKMGADYLANPLSKIFNICFKEGIFPDELKVSQILPIHKAESKLTASNYRPISILPIISKIFEKIIYSRLISFINKYNLLYEKQFGFQQHKSTEHAILQLLTHVIYKC